MQHIERSILLLICLTVLFVSFVGAQEKPQMIKPNLPVTFSLSPDQEKLFILMMKEDDFAEFNWLANENLILTFQIVDSSKKIWLETSSIDDESLVFVAPKEDQYILVIKFDKSSEIKETQNICVEYKNKLKLPIGTKQKDLRRINGYDIKILSAPGTETETEDSIVLIEKNERLKKIMKSGDGGAAGFSFPDDITKAFSAKAKQVIPLIKNTLDKTGDGIPDVMIDYCSGVHTVVL